MQAIIVLFNNHVLDTTFLLSKSKQTVRMAIAEPDYCHSPKLRQQEFEKN
ncbi:hypothetical protein H6G00_03395 [Leptolyngbya sp. FACHB-541]|nr:hypothetical protein [Leptolyngbya sp. FACHB-541]MBD1995672.1 hypothetical protein [Leptolyngbya sp. FACHB-541]